MARVSDPRSVSVDLHCHLLPGLDDGARDLGDALAMAEQAEHDGIEAICATPHIRHDHAVRIAELPGRLAELSAALRAAGSAVEALPGGEVSAGSLDSLDDAELAVVSLGGGGRWILLEPGPGPLGADLDQAVRTLNNRGYRAVIAHPERHPGPDLLPRLAALTAAGALIQVTAGFFLEPATAPGMIALARAGVVHVLGSDAHSSRLGRPVALSAALVKLGTVQPTAAHLRWIGSFAPLALIAGIDVAPPFPARV